MMTSLLLHGQITTTLSKAKELRRIIAPLITLGRRHALSNMEGLTGEQLQHAQNARVNAIRHARKNIEGKDALFLLFGKYAESLKDRTGGYTRVIRSGYRSGDNAPMAVIMLLNDDEISDNPDEISESGDESLTNAEDSTVDTE
jgi:large subunit ribosomal protein L17